jgi:hypothetical protein
MREFFIGLVPLLVGLGVGFYVGWNTSRVDVSTKLLEETARVKKLLNALSALSAMGYAYWKARPGTWFPDHQENKMSAEQREAKRITRGFKDTLDQADAVEEEIRRKIQREGK